VSTPVAPQPGPPRPGGWLRPDAAPSAPAPALDGRSALTTALRDLPVSGHAAVLADEHDRLHRLLATIDQL
jgi:hypothetical protein